MLNIPSIVKSLAALAIKPQTRKELETLIPEAWSLVQRKGYRNSMGDVRRVVAEMKAEQNLKLNELQSKGLPLLQNGMVASLLNSIHPNASRILADIGRTITAEQPPTDANPTATAANSNGQQRRENPFPSLKR